jgi:succinate dehydrogenase flavin-adding protein (antitoxin of CptAB toxin-antitoxin module)
MSKFGEIKSKMLTKLTESYNSGNKNELKDLITKLKSNQNLVDVHNFYEEMENMYFSNKDLAKLYVETLEPHFINRMKLISGDCKDLNKLLKDVVSESNELYECLDILSEENNIHNISKKIDARENFIKLLTTKKSVKKEESTVQFENHTLLNTVLVGNFNAKFTDFLNEEQKETFSKIMSMSNEELINEMSLTRTELNSKIENLLGESTDDMMVEKLKKVKTDINESEITKYNYYKLTELKNGLIV